MILCPNCHHREMVGALYCSQCGAQLISSEEQHPSARPTPPIQKETTNLPTDALYPPYPVSSVDTMISLCLVDSGEIIPLANQDEITIGRISEGQPIIPDVDLTPYQAYENGVSRLHAAIRFDQQQFTAVDLDSANGTRLNGRKIEPYAPQPLVHGDILMLGKLNIQVLIRHI